VLIKIQPDATICRYLFTAKSLYMFRVSQHPSSGVLKTVTATSGTGHNTGTAPTWPDRALQWINICILLHLVGFLLTLNYDAGNHEFKIYKITLHSNMFRWRPPPSSRKSTSTNQNTAIVKCSSYHVQSDPLSALHQHGTWYAQMNSFEDGVCLLWGTNRVFQYNSGLSESLKGLPQIRF